MDSDAKVFEGKSIDEAIDEACTHFDVDRDALEIEIINDASGGIFGLVGGRKASVRAQLRDQSVELKLFVHDVLGKLLEPIVENPSLEISMEGPGRVTAVLDDEEQAGLVIGKEGVTLQALQYIANRILAKQWSEPVRLRLDAGDYRERQNDSLRELAQSLAEKALDQNRSQATRPLSSYHRRVVHMALQGNDDVQTRSKGDGPMKRVIIQPAKSQSDNGANGTDAKADATDTKNEENGADSDNVEARGNGSSENNGDKKPAKKSSGRRRSSGNRGGRRRSGRNNRSKPKTDADSAPPSDKSDAE